MQVNMQMTGSLPIILKSKKHTVIHLLEFFLVSYLHRTKRNSQISFFRTNMSTFPIIFSPYFTYMFSAVSSLCKFVSGRDVGVFDAGISPVWNWRGDCGERRGGKRHPVAVHVKA